MQYTQPYGVTDPNASYVNGNPATATPGSIPPAAAIEAPQREIVAVITAAGLTPSGGNLTQLLAAIESIAGVVPGQITQAMLATGAAPLPHCAVQPADNLNLSNDATTPNTVVDIAAGAWRDDTNVTNLQLASAMAKSLSSSWAAGGVPGTPAGGCDTSSIGNNQTWHAYLIGKLGQAITSYTRASNVATIAVAGHGLGVGATARVTGTFAVDGLQTITAVTTNSISFSNTGANVSTTACGGIVDGFDCLFSQSYPSPAGMPSGWTVKQSLGSVLSGGSSTILPFTQYGDEFMLTTPVESINNSSFPSNTSQSLTLTTPNGVAAQAIMNVFFSVSGQAAAIYLSALASTDAAEGTYGFSSSMQQNSGSSAITASQGRVWTSTGSAIRGRSNAAGTLQIWTLGWRDPRRRMF